MIEGSTVIDVPDAPTELRASGNLDDGEITLRWNKVSGATYNMRYIREVCSSSGVCQIDPHGSWKTVPNIATSGDAVKEARLRGLTPGILYRVEVRAVIVDSSDCSDFALVYPTNSALDSGTVATAPFCGYRD